MQTARRRRVWQVGGLRVSGQIAPVLRVAAEQRGDWIGTGSGEDPTPENRPVLRVSWSEPTPTPGPPPPNPAWVTFRDETARRLVLASVPAEDPEEKDMAVGDFDGDGWLDIIVVCEEPFSPSGPRGPLLLLNRKGVLTDASSSKFVAASSSEPAPPAHTNARDVFVADLNRDGTADRAIANTCNENPAFYRNRGDVARPGRDSPSQIIGCPRCLRRREGFQYRASASVRLRAVTWIRTATSIFTSLTTLKPALAKQTQRSGPTRTCC